MKIAIMADIHSNIEAFKKCYEEAISCKVSEFIFLGDYLGDLAFPRETLELLFKIKKDYKCTFIRGNKENYWINHRHNPLEKWEYGKTLTGMLKYNYDSLSSEYLDFFESLPIAKKMEYEGLPSFTICHGSPFKVSQSMRSDYPYIHDLVKKIDTDMILCAHFHIQSIYEVEGKKLINPGSIGASLHSVGKAQFMILDGENGKWIYSFKTVSYDINKAIEMMELEHLDKIAPEWYLITKHLLMTGEISHFSAMNMALDAYGKANGDYSLIPEEFWISFLKKNLIND